MEFMAIIPARSGSKGLKDKNIIPFGENNLIERSYNFLQGIVPKEKIILTTDYKYDFFSNYIQKKQYRKRPTKISKDHSSMIDVCLDAYKYINSKLNKKITEIILIQPTSPLRNKKDLKKALTIYKDNKLISLASVSPVIQHPYELIKGIKSDWEPLLEWNGHKNRQDLYTNYFYINGCFYIFNVKNLILKKSIVVKETYMFEMDSKYCIDVDDIEDFELAKKLLY